MDMRRLKSLKHRRLAGITGPANLKNNSSTKRQGDDLYRAWTSLRRAYTACKLTYESDIFVAFLGVLQEVAKFYLGDDIMINGDKVSIEQSFPAGL